jgi:hypothetical protein
MSTMVKNGAFETFDGLETSMIFNAPFAVTFLERILNIRRNRMLFFG